VDHKKAIKFSADYFENENISLDFFPSAFVNISLNIVLFLVFTKLVVVGCWLLVEDCRCQVFHNSYVKRV